MKPMEATVTYVVCDDVVKSLKIREDKQCRKKDLN